MRDNAREDVPMLFPFTDRNLRHERDVLSQGESISPEQQVRSGSAYVPETRDNSFVGGSGTTFKNLVHCGSLIVSREHNSNGPLAMLEHDILTFL